MSGFTGEGFDAFPNLYNDLKRTIEYGNENPDGSYIWTTDRLEAVVLEYANFLRRPDNMPRAITTANLIGDRALFELGWRDGVYRDFEAKDEDELCEEGL